MANQNSDDIIVPKAEIIMPRSENGQSVAHDLVVSDPSFPRALHILPVSGRPFFPGQVMPIVVPEDPWRESIERIAEAPNQAAGLLLVQGDNGADVPDPDSGDWIAWQQILSDKNCDPTTDPSSAMCIVSDWGFGTVSSTLLALPAPGADNPLGIYMFAPDRPDQSAYAPV